MGGLGRSARPILQLVWAVLTLDYALAAPNQTARSGPPPVRSRNLRASVNLTKRSVNVSTASSSPSALAAEAVQAKHRADGLEAEKRRLVGRLLAAEKARVDEVKELETRNAALEKRVSREEAAASARAKELEARNAALEKRVAREEAASRAKENMVEEAEVAKAQAKAESIHLANEEQLSKEQFTEESTVTDQDYELEWAAEKLGELRRSNANLSKGLQNERAINVAVGKQVKKFVQQDLERAKATSKQVSELRQNNTRLQDLVTEQRKTLATQKKDLKKERQYQAIDDVKIQKLQGKLQEEKDEISSLLLDKQSLMTTVKSLLPDEDTSQSKAAKLGVTIADQALELAGGKAADPKETSLSEKVKEQEKEMQAKRDAMYYLQSHYARLQSTIANLSAENQQLRKNQSIQSKRFREEQDSLLKKLKGSEERYVREEGKSYALSVKLKSLKAQNSNLNAAVDKEIRQVDTISKVQSEKLQKLKAINHKLMTAWQKALNTSDDLRRDDASKSRQLAKLQGEIYAEAKLEKKYKAEAQREKQDTDHKQVANEKLRAEWQKALHLIDELKSLSSSKDKELAQLKQKYDAEAELEEKYKAEADPTSKALNAQFRKSIQQAMAANKELKREIAAETQKLQKEQSVLKEQLQVTKDDNTALRQRAADAEEQNSRLAAEVEHMGMLNASVAILERDKTALTENMLALNDTLQQEKHALEVKLQEAEDRLRSKRKKALVDHEKAGEDMHAALEKEKETEAELVLARADLKKERGKLQAVLGKQRNMEDEEKASRANLKEEGENVVAALKRETEMEAEMRMTQRATDMKTKAMWALLRKTSDLKSTANALRARNEKLEAKNKKLAISLRTLRESASSEENLEDGAELDEASAPDTTPMPDAGADTRELAALNTALKRQLDSESDFD